jgi:outer membrane protein W
MKLTQQAFLAAALVPALAAGATAQAADDEAWRLKLSGAHAVSTAGGIPQGSLGGGLGLEYRATPRVGVELGGLSAEMEDETEFDFLFAEIDIETAVRITPVLARLNVHLTPGRRADLYLGPVAGYVAMSDLTWRVRTSAFGDPPEVEQVRFPTEDQFTWGAHLGLDVRLGDGGSFLTAGATYLDLPVEVRFPGDDDPPDEEELGIRGDLDPLVFHLGYAYSF